MSQEEFRNKEEFKYEFENYILSPKENLLYRDGKIVRLNFRSYQVLELLVERQGSLVRTEEFFDRVWEGMAVETGNLAVAINAIRKVFQEQGTEIIETLPRRGYRLNAEVKKVCNQLDQTENPMSNLSGWDKVKSYLTTIIFETK